MKIFQSVFLAAAALFVFSGCGDQGKSGVKQDFPEGALYLCTGDPCTHAWNVSMRDLARLYEKSESGDLRKIACPKCGKTSAIRAERCKVCGAPVPSPERRGEIPLCAQHKNQDASRAAGSNNPPQP